MPSKTRVRGAALLALLASVDVELHYEYADGNVTESFDAWRERTDEQQ